MLEAPAAFKKRFASEIDVEAHVVEREVGFKAHVRTAAVDGRTAAGKLIKAVAETVLDAQRREVKAFERAAVRG